MQILSAGIFEKSEILRVEPDESDTLGMEPNESEALLLRVWSGPAASSAPGTC